MAASADTDSLMWSTWLPNGFAREMADACQGVAGALAVFAWLSRWFIAASTVVPFAFWAFADSHSALVAARGLLGGWGFLFVASVFLLGSVAIVGPLIPREYRVDRVGISIRNNSMQDWSRALTLAWTEIIEIGVVRLVGRVAFLRVRTAKHCRRIRIPNGVDLNAVAVLIERLHGKRLVQS